MILEANGLTTKTLDEVWYNDKPVWGAHEYLNGSAWSSTQMHNEDCQVYLRFYSVTSKHSRSLPTLESG